MDSGVIGPPGQTDGPAQCRPGLPASRRRIVQLGLAGAAYLLLAAHTPYRQWTVYRQRHLVIVTNRADTPSFPLGQRLAAVLAEQLPESRARVARAPHAARIASLISSRQMDVALLRVGEARALLLGRPPFADYGPVPLRAIATLGAFVLVCRADFAPRHAYLVAEALDRMRGQLVEPEEASAIEAAVDGGAVPPHPGAAAYYAGRPLPEPGEGKP